eukprot:12086018-Alexandrium_andersonii.AAC.1
MARLKKLSTSALDARIDRVGEALMGELSLVDELKWLQELRDLESIRLEGGGTDSEGYLAEEAMMHGV